MALFKTFIYRHWQDWADLMLGLAVLLSPWLLGFVDVPAPMWNAVIVGAGTSTKPSSQGDSSTARPSIRSAQSCQCR